ncbi:MAG: hypothetical protein EZS28_017539, partial [Streblomastix strix]
MSRGINVTPVKKREVIAKFKKFGKISDTSRLSGIPYTTVRRIIRNYKLGIRSKRSGGQKRVTKRYMRSFKRCAKKARRIGVSSLALLSPKKVSRCTVYRTLREQHMKKKNKDVAL